MAWVAPRTWTAGLTVTAAFMNEIRDALKAVGDPWSSYVPAWTGQTTNPVLGNGTLTGAYMQAGKLVHFRARLVMGSTTTYGAGTWFISLPVTAIGTVPDAIGSAAVFDTSASARSTRVTCLTSSTAAFMSDPSVGSASPYVWATGDIVVLSGTYEAA